MTGVLIWFRKESALLIPFSSGFSFPPSIAFQTQSVDTSTIPTDWPFSVYWPWWSVCAKLKQNFGGETNWNGPGLTWPFLGQRCPYTGPITGKRTASWWNVCWHQYYWCTRSSRSWHNCNFSQSLKKKKLLRLILFRDYKRCRKSWILGSACLWFHTQYPSALD